MDHKNNSLSGVTNTTIHHYLTLFDIDFGLAIFYVILVMFTAVSGVIGNIFNIYVTSKEKGTNAYGRAFIINIAVADLCVSGIADPLCIVGAFHGEIILTPDAWFCEMIAGLCFTVCVCVFLNLTCLTVNRFIFICHNKWYSVIYTNTSTVIVVITSWILAFCAETANIVGWGGHYFDRKSHQCVWNRTASRSFTLFMSLVLIMGPFILMGWCNIAIFREIWSTKRNLIRFDSVNAQRQKQTLISAIQSSRTLLVMFMVFLICWTPYAVVIALDHRDEFSMETHLFVTFLAHTHSCTNFPIYMIFRKGFRDKVRICLKLQNTIEPVSSSNTQAVATLMAPPAVSTKFNTTLHAVQESAILPSKSVCPNQNRSSTEPSKDETLNHK